MARDQFRDFHYLMGGSAETWAAIEREEREKQKAEPPLRWPEMRKLMTEPDGQRASIWL